MGNAGVSKAHVPLKTKSYSRLIFWLKIDMAGVARRYSLGSINSNEVLIQKKSKLGTIVPQMLICLLVIRLGRMLSGLL